MVDAIVISIVVLILLAIIFFRFVFPKIKGIPTQCSGCPAVKKGKKLIKKYRKEQNKNKKD